MVKMGGGAPEIRYVFFIFFRSYGPVIGSKGHH